MIDFDFWKAQADKDIEHVDGLISTPRSSAGAALATELDNLNQWLPRIGQLYGEARAMYNAALGSMIDELYKDEVYKKMATSLFKDIAEGKCSDVLKIVIRLEKLYSSLGKAIDSVRSLLSYEKENMRLTPR